MIDIQELKRHYRDMADVHGVTDATLINALFAIAEQTERIANELQRHNDRIENEQKEAEDAWYEFQEHLKQEVQEFFVSLHNGGLEQ